MEEGMIKQRWRKEKAEIETVNNNFRKRRQS